MASEYTIDDFSECELHEEDEARCPECGSNRILAGICPTCGEKDCCQTCCKISQLEIERDRLAMELKEIRLCQTK